MPGLRSWCACVCVYVPFSPETLGLTDGRTDVRIDAASLAYPPPVNSKTASIAAEERTSTCQMKFCKTAQKTFGAEPQTLLKLKRK